MSALLQIEGVCRSFGGLQALKDASLTVEEGAITALIGPNGAGKTTLFNAITGFVGIDAGSISLDGQRIDGLTAWRIAQRGLARTFQTASGFPNLTVWENLMVAGSNEQAESTFAALLGNSSWRRSQRACNNRVMEQLGRFGLTNLADKRLSEISAASCKLVEIARQLMIRPRLLLLDEPAAGFGPDRIADLDHAIRQLHADGVTILIIEHNLPFVLNLASQAYVLASGTPIYSGSAAGVMQDDQVISHYLGVPDGSARH